MLSNVEVFTLLSEIPPQVTNSSQKGARPVNFTSSLVITLTRQLNVFLPISPQRRVGDSTFALPIKYSHKRCDKSMGANVYNCF